MCTADLFPPRFLTSTNSAILLRHQQCVLALRITGKLGRQHTPHTHSGQKRKKKDYSLQSRSLWRLYFTPSCWWMISPNIFPLLWLMFWHSEALWSKHGGKNCHWIWILTSCKNIEMISSWSAQRERETRVTVPPSLKLSAILPLLDLLHLILSFTLCPFCRTLRFLVCPYSIHPSIFLSLPSIRLHSPIFPPLLMNCS